MVSGKAPYIFQKLPIQTFRAVAAHVRPRPPIVNNHPPQHAEQAHKTGIIQKDRRVAALQALGKGTAVIPVQDPGGPFHRLRQPGVKDLLGYRLPAVLPIQPVQVDQGQLFPFGQRTGKGGFSCAGAADNEDPAHPAASFFPHPAGSIRGGCPRPLRARRLVPLL